MKTFILIVVFLLAGVSPAFSWESVDAYNSEQRNHEAKESNERMQQEFDNHRMEEQLGRQEQQLRQMEFQRNLDNMFPDQKGR